MATDRTCKCELQNRLWNGYGKCLRCGSRYVDDRPKPKATTMDDADEEFFTKYGELAADGRCDLPGGAECDRVHGEWLASGRPMDIADFIVKHANQPPPPKPRWIWVYGYTPVPNAFPPRGSYESSSEPVITDRIDEVHLFGEETIPTEKRGATTMVLDRKHVPLCKNDLYGRRPKWQLFNTGGGDVKRLAAIAGNSTIICSACSTLERTPR